jgi:SpoIID/LytB domain protein
LGAGVFDARGAGRGRNALRVGAARRLRIAATTVLQLLALVVVPLTTAPQALAADDWLYRSAAGAFVARGHGEGHGRGMSQYGAQGAAGQGLSSAQILDFYYPGTVTTQSDPTRGIKVWISADTDNSTEVVRAADLAAIDATTGGTLPVPAEADRVRSVASGAGFVVQARIAGNWTDVALTGTPVVFRRPAAAPVELITLAGDRIGYRGDVFAMRRDGGSITVNELPLDDYVRAVVPRESIASWRPAALQSQAVASRSYASYHLAHPRDVQYHICDTGACQVYGGAWINETAREVDSTNAATAATSGLIRTYQGQAIFAQFGSTNGGWTVDGPQPYLQARPDPYEALANPPQAYANWTGTLEVSSLESRFPSIGSFTRLRIAQRDGNGEWGGRVLAAQLEGTAGSISITGDQLRLALTAPVRSAWFQLFDEDPGRPLGNLDSVALNGVQIRASGWTFDPNDPTAELQVRLADTGPSGATSDRTTAADRPRPDIGAAFPVAGSAHGFQQSWLPSGRGTHRICAHASNIGNGPAESLLTCRWVTVGDAFGTLDSVTGTPGWISARGWAIDPGAPASVTGILLYDFRPQSYRGQSGFWADQSRPDVGTAFAGAGGQHGFNAGIQIDGLGSHFVCAYASPVNPADPTTLIGCREIVVANPFGNLDSLSVRDGMITANGWALDPTAPDRSVEVHLYMSAPGGSATSIGIIADESRPDVARAISWAGPNHGYSKSLPVIGRGVTTVCAYAISTGPSTENPQLACKQISVP